MQQLIESINPSLIWIIIGVIFFLAEIMMPGLVFVFFGFGSWTLALILWTTTIILPIQILIFAVASIFYLIFIRNKWKKHFVGNKNDNENYNENEYLGKKVVVTKEINPPNSGLILYKGSNWQAYSETKITEASLVEIIKIEGIHFTVKPIKEQE